jgi:hypothetical protein
VPWSPYWEHIHEAWEMKENSNLLFLFYEDLVKVSKAILYNFILLAVLYKLKSPNSLK